MPYHVNVTWHIISDQRVRFFWAYVKMTKICKLQDAQKRQPRAEFGILQDVRQHRHSTIHYSGNVDSIYGSGKAIKHQQKM